MTKDDHTIEQLLEGLPPEIKEKIKILRRNRPEINPAILAREPEHFLLMECAYRFSGSHMDPDTCLLKDPEGREKLEELTGLAHRDIRPLGYPGIHLAFALISDLGSLFDQAKRGEHIDNPRVAIMNIAQITRETISCLLIEVLNSHERERRAQDIANFTKETEDNAS